MDNIRGISTKNAKCLSTVVAIQQIYGYKIMGTSNANFCIVLLHFHAN